MTSASRLVIMRHGEAGPGRVDAARALTSRGEREASRMGAWLANDYRHTLLALYASPFVRAQQTATLVGQALGQPVRTLEGITPDDDPQAVCDWLLEQQEGCIVLVSHMPLVGMLTGRLVEGARSPGVGFATAAVAELDGDVWAAGCARLVRFTEPSMLG
ncbi:phosphohistidine phosphatase SixA [Vreelandella malpeensis]|uniref:Phosphohistidine phosphatase SixA n=1 Tax=Vreelandella malpeensis TaxID=1172368 RepID=A0ABS8DUZ2_9GAMM|nr:phosphohistidine phosphatase SixA [Halomonas malpeensis]MCB8889685.1 phosphohistidine phosphatase SixA [Halomonas malpeensis]